MNVKALNPHSNPELPSFFESAIPFTIFTAWLIMVFQSKYMFKKPSLQKQITWPFWLVMYLVKRAKDRKGDTEEVDVPVYEKPPPYSEVLW